MSTQVQKFSILIRLFRPYFYFLIFFVFALLNRHFNFFSDFDRLPKNVGAYIFDSNIVMSPTFEMMNDYIGQPIRKFDDKETILILGNSIIRATGGKDRFLLNRHLSQKYNVINAAVGGGYLNESVVTAIYGLSNLPESSKKQTLHVFLIYNITVWYAYGEYYYTDVFAGRFCQKFPELQKYILNCPNLIKKLKWNEIAENVDYDLLRLLPCAVNPSLVLNWIKTADFTCLGLADAEKKERNFLEEYNKDRLRPITTEEESYIRKTLESQVLNRTNSSSFDDLVSETTTRLKVLEQYLKDHDFRYKIHFMLLPNSPRYLSILSPTELENYQKIRQSLLLKVQKGIPDLQVSLGPKFTDPNDYFDGGHYRESGQTKLADFIIGLAEQRK